MTYHRDWMSTAGIVMTLLVILGAFGAHGLESKLPPDDMETFLTGQRYGLFHGLGLILVNLVASHLSINVRWVNRFLVGGLLLFTASLMVHACRELLGLETTLFAMLAPIGGLSYVTAWILFALQVRRQ